MNMLGTDGRIPGMDHSQFLAPNSSWSIPGMLGPLIKEQRQS